MLLRSLMHRRYQRLYFLAWLLVSTSLALCLDPRREPDQYGRRSWQTDSGLPQNTVRALLQTRDGYLWIGTEGGLVRFDGVQFVVYDKQAPAHLPNAAINSLFEDASGDLWIGTDDGLVRHRGQEFVRFTTNNGLPSNTIWSTFQSRAGALWVVAPDGLARLHNGSFEPVPIDQGIVSAKSVAEGTDASLWIGTRGGLMRCTEGHISGAPLLPNVEIEAVATTPDGRVWAGARGGLYSFDPAKPGPAMQIKGLASDEITALRSARDGSLWIGTAQGLAVSSGGATTHYGVQEGLPSERVTSIYEDRDGGMWIATARGVARVYQGRVQAFGAREPLSSEVVLTLFEDREGSIWLGTESGGLEMLHDQKFTSYTTADGLTDDLVRSVTQDRSGVVWIGTNGGGLNRFDHGRFTGLTTKEGLSSDIVLAIAADPDGVLWVGTPDGLNKIENGHVKAFTSADGLADDFVRSLYVASDGSLWIGTRRGLSHFVNGRFISYSSIDGLGSDLVGAITEDSSHALWIATLGGVTRFDHGKFTTLTTRDGLSGNVITALYADHEDNLWIGTNQSGLSRLRDGKITAYPAQQSRLPESVYSMLEDDEKNLWIGSKTGIYRVSKKDLQEFADHRIESLTPAVFGTADGMKVSECSSGGHPAAWELADGSMWFATLKGIAAVDPRHLSLNTEPPPMVIEEVLIDDVPVDAEKNLTVAPAARRFEFRYAGLSFIAPQKVRYRYKLEGFDRDWVDAGTRRTAYYTSLPAKQYRFRVMASNNDGVWNETGASIDFRLTPHFYQTLWFYLALALGLALLAYAVYRWRLQQVELRYSAVLSERGRIAREIHDTLAQGLVGISVQLELVNRLMASSVESARTQLDAARGLVRESIAEARSSIWDLRSQAAETEDFATRLSRMAATATENCTPKIRVKSKVLGTYRPLAPKVEAELLRIAQEAVTNAVRHAQPREIVIELRYAARLIEMTIEDDGRGFDGQPHPQASGPEGHYGLTGMRERAAEIGGTLTVESAPQKGTRVTASVPLES